MDRLLEIKLLLEALESKRREVSEVEQNLVQEYRKIVAKRQKEEEKKNQKTKKVSK